MDKLKEILRICKCGVFLVINEHRDYYQSVEEKLEELKCLECPPDIPDNVRDEMIERDTVIDLQVYPDTPIGSYSVYHYDLDKAMDEILKAIQPKPRKKKRERVTK